MNDHPSPPGPPDRDPYDPKNRAENRAEAEAQIRQAQEALSLLDVDPEVREAFAQHGFGPEKIEEGRRHLQSLVEAMKREQEAWCRVHEAEAVQKQKEEELLRTYAVHAHIAREAFKDDPETLRALGLDQPLPPIKPEDPEGSV